MASVSESRRVVVVGGGAAGASVAINLASHGLKPMVLETLREPESKVGECLPPTAAPILQRLGLADQLQRDGHLPSYGNRSVWGAPAPVERDFIFGTQGHGWQLDRARFEARLMDRARAEGVDWRGGVRLVECVWRDECWTLIVRTSSGDATLEADFVVDATGRASRLARRLGARQLRYDRLVGTACLLKSRSGNGIKDSFTLVEAVRSGWWYSARLPDEKLMAVFFTDHDLLDHEVLKADGWFALLRETEHTGRRVREGDYDPLAEPRVLAAHGSCLDVVAGERWLAVGDAAAAYDPLSSYGISAALGAGVYAASAIVDSLAGSRDALPAYRRIIEQSFAQYLIRHEEYYALERRWLDELFWKRRHEPVAQRA
ncbi:MAG: NAD(P)/FAD-dependent oxidoreductase [Acidobacteria bacterium]|nr:NAD(P)/FAD-dependent oxidoreductase [Acidobacteriota bacterium]